MRILLSAYACDPTSGSEPGIGWNWAINISKLGHQVWVVTRKKNKINIETATLNNSELKKIKFIYFDLSPMFLKLKNTMGVHIYYELWQYNLLKFIKNKHEEFNFELVHHITFGVLRQPSYLYQLNIPFIFGPIGGAEYMPGSLKKKLSFRAKAWEYVREISNDALLRRPTLNACFKNANLIFSKTDQTAEYLLGHGFNSIVHPDIGVNKLCDSANINPNSTSIFSILYVGRLLHWKGIHLALKAFKIFSAKYPNSSFTIIGTGSFEKFLKKLVIELGLSDKVIFIGWVKYENISSHYRTSKVFLFPSLHDSSGTVVLEAMNYNLPVVALALGGPGVLLGKNCPTLIPVHEGYGENIIELLADMLSRLYDDKFFYKLAQNWSKLRIEQYQWVDVVRTAYNKVDKSFLNKISK